MEYIYSRVPANHPELHNQTELSDITDEEFNQQWKEPHYKWYHRIYQILCFFIFLGPLRVVVAITGFLICILFVTYGRKLQLKVFKSDRKHLKGFFYSVLQISIRFLALAFGHVHIKVNGKVDPETRIVITNHTAFHDPFIVNYVLPVSVVCKQELGEGDLKYMLDVVDPIYVRRDQPGGRTKLIIDQANNSEMNPVLIFPEGTLTNGDITLKYHKGAFLTDKKVQPILLTYHMPLVPKGWNSYAWTVNNTLAYIWECCCMPFNILTIDILPAMTVNDADGTPEGFAKKAQLIVSNHFGTKATTRSSDEIFRKRKDIAAQKAQAEKPVNESEKVKTQ